jgi:hypothetical protein
MKAKIEDGKITGYFIGITAEKDFIDVPEKVAANPDEYNYMDGKFVERKIPEQPKIKSVEERVAELEKQVSLLTNQKLVEIPVEESL